MFFSHFAMQSNYLFQWMKPSLKVMIFLQQIDKAWHQFFGRTRQNCLTPHPLLDHWMHTLTHFVMAISLLSVAASPREYLVRRAAKNVISPPQNHPKPTAVYKPWSHYFVALRSCRTPYAGMLASLHPPHFWTTWAQLGVSFGQQGVGLVCNLQVLAPIWVQLGPIHFSWLPTDKLT